MSAIGLPVNILANFVPRPPIAFQPPPRSCKPTQITSMSQYVSLFESETPPPRETRESPQAARARRLEEKRVLHEDLIQTRKVSYQPAENPAISSNPYKTLFVGRLAYETTERTLRRVFEEWGKVGSITIVHDKDGKSRGYAFIEYEHERDMKEAYKRSDGIKIDGRHVLVDVERARTVPNWIPRRLGGGKGPQREGFNPKQRKRKVNPYQSDMQRGPPKRQRSPARGNQYHDNRYDRRDDRDSRRSSFNY